MKLFAVYVGGETEGSLIELHDIRFVIADRIEDAYDDLKAQWWGKPESLHLDCWGALVSADGYNIHLKPEPSGNEEKLYFINLGGYDPGEFTELHKNMFIVAPTEAKARLKAVKSVPVWNVPHKDYMYDVEKTFCLNDVVAQKSLYIHLEKTDHPVPFEFTCKYNPIGRTIGKAA